MCDSGEGGCIANSLFCDTKEDCSDGSDEKNCGFYVHLNVPFTLEAAVIAMVLLFILHKGIKLFLGKRTFSFPEPDPPNPVVLRLPPLNDFELDITEYLSFPTFEMTFFNEENSLFLNILDVIQLHNLCPQRRHNLLQGFLSHLKRTYQFPDDDTIFIFLREKFGACSSMRLLLDSRNRPGPFDTWKHTLRLRGLHLPTIWIRLHYFWEAGLGIGALLWDFVKDIAFFIVLYNIYWNGGGEKSPMEASIIRIILVSILTSQLISGFYSFYRRHNWLNVQWKTTWEQFIFQGFLLAISPVLPFLKMLKVSQLRNDLVKLESSFVKQETGLKETLNEITRIKGMLVDLEDEVTIVYVIDACLESIINCSCLLSLLVFYDLNFYTARGRYKYLDNLAVALLSRGNLSDTFFFVGGIITSTLAASGKFALYLNWCKRAALSPWQKIYFMLFFFLAIFARVWSLVLSIHMSSLNFNNWLQTAEYQDKEERTGQLSDFGYRLEFLTYRPKQFATLKESMMSNIIIVVVFFTVHLVLNFLLNQFFIPAFKDSSIRDKLVNLLANLFVPLPFCQTYETPLWKNMLVTTIHGLENLLLFYICLLAYPDEEVTTIKVNWLYLVLPMVTFNMMGLLLLVLYNRVLSSWAFLNNSMWMRRLVPKTLPKYDFDGRNSIQSSTVS